MVTTALGVGKELFEIQYYISLLNYDDIEEYDLYTQLISISLKEHGIIEEEEFLKSDLKGNIDFIAIDSEIEEQKKIDNILKNSKIKVQNTIVDEISCYMDTYNISGIYLDNKSFDDMIDYYYEYFKESKNYNSFLDMMRLINRYAVALSLLTDTNLDIDKYYYSQEILETFYPSDKETREVEESKNAKIINLDNYRYKKNLTKVMK